MFALTLSASVSTTAQTGGGSSGAAPASVKILTGALISPATANSYYGSSVVHTDGICRDYAAKAELCPGGSASAAPLAPELRELSRALRGGSGLNLQDTAAVQEHVDLVYEYVRNRIDTEFIFGSHKGALGAVIEGSGTAFDQAALMVKLLRESGVAADYRYGTITLTAEQFSAWTGISQAKAACNLLGVGGVPATVAGGCASTGSTGSVTLAHVWVSAVIGGQTYVYDPAYKTYEHVAGIDVRQIMGLSAGQPLVAATSGMSSGTTSSVPYVSGLNRTGLDTQLNTYATALLDRLEDQDLRGAGMAEVVGGRILHAVSRPAGGWKQTALPYASTLTATWSGVAGVPDQFRATLQLNAVIAGSTPTTMVAGTFFVDEIYGRRLEIANSGGGASLASTWTPVLRLDGVGVFAGAGLYGAHNLVLHLDLTANHPFAAESGAYADATVRKIVDYLQPAAIVHGWGHASAALSSKWEREQAVDRQGPLIYQGGAPAPITQQGQGGATLGFLGGGDLLRARLGATWLAQFAMSRDLHGELAGARVSHLHTLGVVSSNSNAVPTIDSIGAPSGPLGGTGYAVQDETTVIDLESSFGLVSRTSDAVSRRAAIHATAATAATLEASVLQQLTETPDAASTASRFAWGNNPERVCATGVVYCETETGTARAAHRYISAAAAANAASLVRYDNGTNAPTAFGGLPAVSASVSTALKGNLASAVQRYADAGFDVTASAESNLGPGHRHGSEYALWTIQVETPGGTTVLDNHQVLECVADRAEPSTSANDGQSCMGENGQPGTLQHLYDVIEGMGTVASGPTITTTGYMRLPTLQRGGALIANRYDVNGDPLEIAHVLTRVGAPFKGGGGASVTQGARFDPNDAGQALKDQFVDRSGALGVNLTDGTARFVSPTLASVGQGEFPHSLERRLEIRGGDLRPASSTDFEPVVVSNWDGEAKIASSAYEAMGQSRVQAAVPTIVAFVVMQDMWKAAPSAQREVAGALVADWWADHVLANLITIFQGADAQQFVRVQGSRFIAAGGGAASITLTGTREAVRPNIVSPEAQPDPNRSDPQNWQKESTARQWTWSAGAGLVLRGGQGDEREYASFGGLANAQYFEEGYHAGFTLEEWRFPFGVELTFQRTAPGAQVTGVVSNTGLSLAVPLPSNSVLTGGCVSTTSMLFPSSSPSTVLEVRDIANRLTKAEFRQSQARSVSQRPHDACPLQWVFAPLSATTAALSYEFDSVGRIKTARDAIAVASPSTRGAHQFFVAEGYRGERQDPLGGRYAVETLRDGRLQRHIDEMGRASAATFDGSGRLTGRTSAWGDTLAFLYDERDNLIQRTQMPIVGCSTGLTTEQASWWCQTVVIKAEYHPTWNKPTKVILPATAADPVERQWTLTYNAQGLPYQQTGPTVLNGLNGQNAQPVWTTWYDAYGRVTQTRDPTGVETAQVWGGGGLPAFCLTQSRLASQSGGIAGLTTTFGCDAVGNVTTVTDPRGNTTTATYDVLRRKTAETGPAGTNIQTQWVYDLNGNPTEEKRWDSTAAAWRTTTSTWSLTGKPLTVTDPSGDVARTCYDALDRPVTVIDGERRATLTVYNLASQPTEIHRFQRAAAGSCSVSTELPPDAGFTETRWRRFQYNAGGLQSAEIDARGNVTQQQYDGLGRPARTIYADGAQAWTAMDQRGQAIFRRQRGGGRAAIFYDAAGRDYHVREYAEADQAYMFKGRNSRASYDLAGRPVWRDVSSQTTLTTTFDDSLRRDVRTYGYDTGGRMTSEQWRPEGVASGAISFTTGYGYDVASNRTSINWPGAWTATYAYDAANRIQTVSFPGASGAQTVTLSHDSLSRRTAINRPGAAADTSYAWEPDSDLASMGHAFVAGTGPGAVSFTYGHDAAGKTTSIGINQPAFEWAPTLAYARTYGAANVLNQVASEGGVAIAFNPDGNMTSDGVNTYSWTLGNRMIGASRAGMTATYDYDSDDRRTRKTVNGMVTRTLWSGADELAEYDATGTLLRRFVPDGTGAMDARLATVTTAGAVYWHHVDHQGSVIATSDSAGQTVGTASYSPYGEFGAGTSTPPLHSPFGYTGRQYDPETGLYQYRARYYSPRLGQFLTMDPIGTKDDPNLYGYVANDPVNNTDPTGKCYAAAAATAGGAALVDGPIPVGDAVGVVILGGACIYRGYQAYRAFELMRALGGIISNADDFNDEIFDHIGAKPAAGGVKVDGDVEVGEIPGELLGEAEELLEASIGTRQRENDRSPRGNPNGNDRERRDYRSYQGHAERIAREQRWLEEVRRRQVQEEVRRPRNQN